MDPRSSHEIRFADGGVLTLGAVTRVMGVLNVTPDSFHAASRLSGPEEALETARRMLAEGADLLDVGGESTRPGAAAVGVAEEAARVVPVVQALKRRLDVRVSVDTSKAEVARRALDAGADLINDVTALGDPAMLPLVCARRVPVVLMHMRGTPRTMQQDTRYGDLVEEVRAFLDAAARRAVEAGVGDGKILVDPGLGFGKSAAGSLELLRRLHAFSRTGRPIVIGASRKSFLGLVLDLPVEDRLEASIAVAAYAAAQGAHVIRAHDVAATARVVRVVDAIRGA